MSCLISKFELLREEAQKQLPKKAFDYIDGGSDDEITLRNNRDSWRRIELIPRVLTGPVQKADISYSLFGSDHNWKDNNKSQCM